MRRILPVLLAICSPGVAHGDALDTITFSFPQTTLQPYPYSPPDVLSAIQRSVVVPASPTPLQPTLPALPNGFVIDPGFDGPAYPPQNDELYFFDPFGEGYVFVGNIGSPRAYMNFSSAQIYSGSAADPTFVPGTYAAFYLAPVFNTQIFGTITVTADTSTPSAVPEPASLGLLATGALAGVHAFRRRRKS